MDEARALREIAEERGRNGLTVQTCVRLAGALEVSREVVFDVCSLALDGDDATEGGSDVVADAILR